MSDQIHYRLLSEGEIIQEGDEYWDYRSHEWIPWDRATCCKALSKDSFPYRRSYAPFQWTPVEERHPCQDDADDQGYVAAWSKAAGGTIQFWTSLEDEIIAWAKIPPYIPAASSEEKEFEAWYSQNSSEPTNSPAWKLAKDAWMAAKKGGKA